MNFSTTTVLDLTTEAELLVIKTFKDQKNFDPKVKKLDLELGGLLSQRIRDKDFSGKLGETSLLYPSGQNQIKRIVLLGLGKKDKFSLRNLRIASSKLAPLVKKYKVKELTIQIAGARPPRTQTKDAIQEETAALLLSLYSFDEYKEKKDSLKLESIKFILKSDTDRRQAINGAESGEKIAEAVKFARDLGNHPGNVATPKHIASHAELMAKDEKKIKVKVLGPREIKKEKMGALMAVSQGSDQEPRFIIMEYRARKTAPTVALVGKGITFDSGGISIKPADKMEEMKFDMAGAATVMGAIKAAAAENLPVNLIGLVAASENLLSGSSIKPGDIIETRSGKTVEIINTDAEGRLVLADALDYAKQYKPDLTIDFATLTGAIVVALGDDLIGLFSNNDKYAGQMKKSGDATDEQVWEMPLEKSYNKFMKSDFADLRNIGTIRYGDSINAALFLQNFTSYPWIHLDIAGVAWATREKPYRTKGATGVGVRLVLDFLKNFKK